MLGSPKPNNGEPMRRLLIFIISLLLSIFILFTFSIFDGERTGDREKHDQETVTWSNGEKYEVKFSDGRMYNQIV
jgi:hypothetical protein